MSHIGAGFLLGWAGPAMQEIGMHRYLRVALMVTLAVTLVVTVGCQGRRSITLDSPTDALAQAAPVTEMILVEGEVGGAPVPAPAADPLVDDLRVRAAVERDKIRFVVQQKLDAARDHIRAGDYASAERLLLEAQQLDPLNRDVRAELRDVQAYLGRRPAAASDMLEGMRRLTKVRVDEQRTTAGKFVNVGRMQLQNRRFDDAIENFEQALFIIESSPYSVDWNGLDEQAEQGLREARQMKLDAQRAEHRDAVEASLTEMAQAEEQRLLAEQQRLERLMGSAVEAFCRGDFETSQYYAERVLDAQPDNTKARDLQMASRRAYHEQVEQEYLKNEKRAFREWMIDIQNTRILQDKILKWPSQSFWDRITETRKRSRASFGDLDMDPEAEALQQKVESTNVNLQVESQEFKEVIKLLQIQTGINIHIDPRIESDVAENPVNGLYVEDLPLSTVLDLLRGSAGEEAIWLTKGNVVLFTNRSLVKKNLMVQLHDVSDLTTGLTDFIPPTIQLVGPDSVSDEENPLFGAEGEEPRLPYGTIDELTELIQNAVDPTFWEETEGAQIRSQGEHLLVVRATPEIQEQIERFLRDLRGFAGIVVTVETRFLEVGDYFLRDVGVDFRGLGGQTPGPLVNLDDVTNGLEDQSSAGYDNGGWRSDDRRRAEPVLGYLLR